MACESLQPQQQFLAKRERKRETERADSLLCLVQEIFWGPLFILPTFYSSSSSCVGAQHTHQTRPEVKHTETRSSFSCFFPIDPTTRWRCLNCLICLCCFYFSLSLSFTSFQYFCCFFPISSSPFIRSMVLFCFFK